MRTNLLASQEYHRTEADVEDEEDVLEIIKEFLQSYVYATDDEFEIIFRDLEKERNHEIRFDDTKDIHCKHGTEGQRVAYGAFTYSALVHGIQTVWTYTFEILREDDTTLYFGADSWGWTQDTNLSEKVSTHLE